MTVTTLLKILSHPATGTAVLTLTLIALLFYAYDTHRIADQGSTAFLRPVILREGVVENWNVPSVKQINQSGSSEGILRFRNLRNIAQDISGYIILENKKYKLVFGNDASEKHIEIDGSKRTQSHFFPKWEWLPEDGLVTATYQEEESEETPRENGIEISFSDIEGNKYFLKEDKDFAQKNLKK